MLQFRMRFGEALSSAQPKNHDKDSLRSGTILPTLTWQVDETQRVAPVMGKSDG
jgi:hypothetical protein